jgi:hypothetical protein
MGLIREPLDVDFYVIDKPYTKAEREAMSLFIKNDQQKKRRMAKKTRSRKKAKATV